jgi:hypothetical protein
MVCSRYGWVCSTVTDRPCHVPFGRKASSTRTTRSRSRRVLQSRRFSSRLSMCRRRRKPRRINPNRWRRRWRPGREDPLSRMQELLRRHEVPRAAAHGQDLQALWRLSRCQMHLALADADADSAGGIPGGPQTVFVLCYSGGRSRRCGPSTTSSCAALCLCTPHAALYESISHV